MAGGSRELGFVKSNGAASLREQLARTTLRNVRLKGHMYVELRDDNKKPIFFCVLCQARCYSDSVLNDHLRGHLHNEMYEAAKATLLKGNPWPFNDGMLFFDNSLDEDCRLPPSNGDCGRTLLQNTNFDQNSLAIVSADDFTSERSPNSVGADESLNGDEDDCDLIIPDVLYKDKVSDLAVRSIGVGKIAARFWEKDVGSKGINRIWCEWLGKTSYDDDDMVPQHDFAIVLFAFNCDLGRKGLIDDMRFLLSSPSGSAVEETKTTKGKKRKSRSDPEDVSDSLSNQYESSGEESLASGSSNSKSLSNGFDDNALQLRLMRSKTVRKELRVHRRRASERVCDICQHKMLPGKDVATLLNMNTGRLVCSSRNINGAFHVYHISCLIHWVLFCEFEVCAKELASPKVKKRCRRKKGAKASTETPRQQIYSAFCPECQGTGKDIDGDELEKPTVSLSEMFKYKMKASDAHREYIKKPEMLQNCSTGFYFPLPSEETMQEYVSTVKMLHFYRAVE